MKTCPNSETVGNIRSVLEIFGGLPLQLKTWRLKLCGLGLELKSSDMNFKSDSLASTFLTRKGGFVHAGAT